MMTKSSVAAVFLCTSWLWLLCCICILPLSLASAHNTEAGTSASAGAPSSSSTCLDSQQQQQQQQQQHEHGINNEHNACVGVDVESSIPRGGGLVIPGGDGLDIHTKDVILRFIESSSNSNKEKGAAADNIDIDYPFHIQGWRWHFLSLIRDAKRLERLANHLHLLSSSEEEDGLTALEQAANYAINFNMAGLFRIESSMFVPFLREHLCQDDVFISIRNRNGNGMDGKSNVNVKAVASAFRKAVDAIDAHRVQSEKIGKILVSRYVLFVCLTFYRANV